MQDARVGSGNVEPAKLSRPARPVPPAHSRVFHARPLFLNLKNIMIEIGSFQIDLGMRTLRKNGEVVHVGSRAFDILAVVASAGGRLVTKDELMDSVWPNTVVEENNVQVHLSALRKILGADRDLILTVPGRGYQLLQRRKNASAAQFAAPASNARSLPPSKAGLQGRRQRSPADSRDAVANACADARRRGRHRQDESRDRSRSPHRG